MPPRSPAGSSWLRWLDRFSHVVPLLWVLTAVLLPLVLALWLLQGTAAVGLPGAWLRLGLRSQTAGALEFSLLEAALSTLATLAIGLPVAWQLARYRWPAHRLLRALLTAPFMVPTVAAAIGFLALLGNDGPLAAAGIDLLSSQGTVGRLATRIGWPHLGPVTALILAHAWFNLSLVVRFVETAVARLDPAVEQAARLLPHGATRWRRLRFLWLPLLWPVVAAAAALIFVFSFTSFVLVRWLCGPGIYTLERAMAEMGGAAGIKGYGAVASEVVLALGSLQLLVILTALGVMAWLQQRRNRLLPLASERQVRQALPPLVKRSHKGSHLAPAACLQRLAMALTVLAMLAPMAAVVIGALQIRGEWSLQPWQVALWGGSSTGGRSMLGPLASSLSYAALTLVLALVLGLLAARTIVAGERSGTKAGRWWAWFNDLLIMTPLALSAVVIGLGVLIGILRYSPGLFQAWWLPALGHLVIATPFALRALLPAIRSLDPAYLEMAQVLGVGPWRRFRELWLPLLRGPLVVAASLVLACSLGEFGATWVLVSSADWMTLPVFIDVQLNRPFDPLARPVGHVAATVLVLATVLLFSLVERFRLPGQGGEM